MPPSSTCTNSVNGFVCNLRVILGYCFKAFVSLKPPFTHIQNIFICKLVHRVLFALFQRRDLIADSSFGFSVLHIVEVGSKKKMNWIAARSIITVVTYVHVFRNWATYKFKYNPMRAGPLHAMFAMAITCSRIKPLIPVPALVKTTDINVLKEPLLKRWLPRPFYDCSFKSPFDSLLVCFHVAIMALVTTLAQGLLWH